MKYDFSGWATKANLLCTDGRTILPNAFKHNDGVTVPLVYQHLREGTENLLGHAVLENRPEGVYAYCSFIISKSGQEAREAVVHGDLTALSIYANQLRQNGDLVQHGSIREVSLVIAGANPGAVIDNISFSHSSGDVLSEEDAIITTGIPLELYHEADNKEGSEMANENNEGGKTVGDVVNSMSEEQKNVMYYFIDLAQNGGDEDEEVQQQDDDDDYIAHNQEGHNMPRNLFANQADVQSVKAKQTLSHSQEASIFAGANQFGSLKESVLAHAATYGIDNIDILFPDAQAISNTPSFIARKVEWVAGVLSGTTHRPFSRIKSMHADITGEKARALGYVTGTRKKEEVFPLLKRTTGPTTIYKKQKLDRDDTLDITDFNVIAWLKAEMRLMLDEEIARAILIGDGREVDDEDKVDEDHIRPIAHDDEFYAHVVELASDTEANDIVEAVLYSRRHYRGTGNPTLYTTDAILTDLILQKDKVGRRLFETEQALAAALRVRNIVTVDVMDGDSSVVGILVNLADYTVGADAGARIGMYDDFDIDYNQYKYLIETRISGALTVPKSAIVIKKDAGTVVTPDQPAYDAQTKVITIPNKTGVKYFINNVEKSAGALPAITESTEVEARPASGYSFPHGTDADWFFKV